MHAGSEPFPRLSGPMEELSDDPALIGLQS
jgi:hypothetical protein